MARHHSRSRSKHGKHTPLLLLGGLAAAGVGAFLLTRPKKAAGAPAAIAGYPAIGYGLYGPPIGNEPYYPATCSMPAPAATPQALAGTQAPDGTFSTTVSVTDLTNALNQTGTNTTFSASDSAGQPATFRSTGAYPGQDASGAPAIEGINAATGQVANVRLLNLN